MQHRTHTKTKKIAKVITIHEPVFVVIATHEVNVVRTLLQTQVDIKFVDSVKCSVFVQFGVADFKSTGR